MSSRIEKGDMVMLVRACCQDGHRHLGWIGTVEAVAGRVGVGCGTCCFTYDGAHALITIVDRGWVPLPWLLKISPPQTSKQQHRTEELMA